MYFFFIYTLCKKLTTFFPNTASLVSYGSEQSPLSPIHCARLHNANVGQGLGRWKVFYLTDRNNN